MSNNFKKPSTPTTGVDMFISFGIFIVIQMFIAFILKALVNKVLYWYHLPTIDYWVMLSAWLAWIIVFVIPLISVGMVTMQELAFQLAKLQIYTGMKINNNTNILENAEQDKD